MLSLLGLFKASVADMLRLNTLARSRGQRREIEIGLDHVGLRGLMEFGIVAGFAFWGHHVADSTGIGILFAVDAVLVGFGFLGSG
jgi:hypothetical protein